MCAVSLVTLVVIVYLFFLSSEDDAFGECLMAYVKASSAVVNWLKCVQPVSLGLKGEKHPLTNVANVVLTTSSLKVLGVFWGNIEFQNLKIRIGCWIRFGCLNLHVAACIITLHKDFPKMWPNCLL